MTSLSTHATNVASAVWAKLQSWMPTRWRQPRPVVREAPPPAEPGPPVAAPEKPSTHAGVSVSSGDVGDACAYDLKSVLDGLDDSFRWLKHLRQVAPSYYALHTRVGGVIAPKDSEKRLRLDGTGSDQPPVNWPGFMLIHWGGEDEAAEKRENRMTPRVFAFRKIEAHGDFVAVGNTFYECAAVFGDRDDPKPLAAVGFFIGIDEQRRVWPLRMITSTPQTIPVKRGRRVHGGTVVCHRKMDYPDALKKWANDPDRRRRCEELGDDPSIEGLVRSLFFMTLNLTLASERGPRVNVARGNMVSVFCVPATRTSYFFRDRELHVAVDGRRKKIFHAVAEHDRRLPNGKVRRVRAHYRGERGFGWKGYQVLITVPGLHHPPLASFTASSMTADQTNGRRTVSAGVAGRMIKGHIWNDDGASAKRRQH